MFVISFFLPACNLPHSTDPGFNGYDCAKTALILAFEHGDSDTKSRLLKVGMFVSDLLNLFVILYLIPRMRGRRVIAGCMMLSMVATWIVFFFFPLVPLIGHVLWIAGALLILSPELVKRGSPAQAAPDPA